MGIAKASERGQRHGRAFHRSPSVELEGDIVDVDNHVMIGIDPHKRSVTMEVVTHDEQVLGGGR